MAAVYIYIYINEERNIFNKATFTAQERLQPQMPALSPCIADASPGTGPSQPSSHAMQPPESKMWCRIVKVVMKAFHIQGKN